MAWPVDVLGPKPSSNELRRALQPCDDFAELVGGQPCEQTFSSFIGGINSGEIERIKLPHQRIYLCGLGAVTNEDDPATPSLLGLAKLLSAFVGESTLLLAQICDVEPWIGAPIEIWQAPKATKFAIQNGQVLAPQLFEILHRAMPGNHHPTSHPA